MARPIYWSPHGGITNDWPLERLLASVAGAGYAGIEAVATPDWMDWRDGGSLARLRATIERFGLTCPSVCWRGNQDDLYLTAPQGHASARAYLEGCIDAAALLGGDRVLIWPRVAPGVSRADALATAARILSEVAERCREQGVQIALEFESRGDPLCGTPAEALDLVALAGDHVSVCCDSIHLHNRGLEAYSSVLSLRGRLGVVHLSDSERRVPGEGEFDFPTFVRALGEIAYAGPVFVQIDPRAEEEIGRALQRAREFTAPLG